jgi:hypothetical protein
MADADLASNGFITFAGNQALLDGALYWLLEAAEPPPPPRVVWLDLTHAKARALFWIPTVIWPLVVVWIWYLRHRRRRRAAG